MKKQHKSVTAATKLERYIQQKKKENIHTYWYTQKRLRKQHDLKSTPESDPKKKQLDKIKFSQVNKFLVNLCVWCVCQWCAAFFFLFIIGTFEFYEAILVVVAVVITDWPKANTIIFQAYRINQYAILWFQTHTSPLSLSLYLSFSLGEYLGNFFFFERKIN